MRWAREISYEEWMVRQAEAGPIDDGWVEDVVLVTQTPTVILTHMTLLNEEIQVHRQQPSRGFYSIVAIICITGTFLVIWA